MRFLAALSLRQARFLAVAWALFLFALTSWPSPPEVPAVAWIPSFDKLVHACLYGIEGFLLFRAIAWTGSEAFSWRRALIVGAIMAVWGTLDEIHQLWIPGRSCEVADAVTDAVAGFCGAVVASVYSARYGLPRRTPATAAPSPRS